PPDPAGPPLFQTRLWPRTGDVRYSEHEFFLHHPLTILKSTLLQPVWCLHLLPQNQPSKSTTPGGSTTSISAPATFMTRPTPLARSSNSPTPAGPRSVFGSTKASAAPATPTA